MFVLKDERRCDNQYRRSELLKDEMTVNLIFANNLRDFRISIIHRIGISDGSKQRLYIYIRSCERETSRSDQCIRSTRQNATV